MRRSPPAHGGPQGSPGVLPGSPKGQAVSRRTPPPRDPRTPRFPGSRPGSQDTSSASSSQSSSTALPFTHFFDSQVLFSHLADSSDSASPTVLGSEILEHIG